jgi:hypothetical protein
MTSFLRVIVKRINETWDDSPFQSPIGVQVSDPKEQKGSNSEIQR